MSIMLSCFTTNAAFRNDPRYFGTGRRSLQGTRGSRFAQLIHATDFCRISVANFVEPVTVEQGHLARQAFPISATGATKPG
jgi:hypothetical protein